MTARREQYLWLGAPLSKLSINFSLADLCFLAAGLSVVCLASIGSMVVPATAPSALSVLEYVSLYGGLAIFAGVLLFDTQKIVANAEKAQHAQTLSSIDESINIYLDTMQIFVRILTLLIKYEERKKKRSASTSETH